MLACACSFGSDEPGGAAPLGASSAGGTDQGDDADDDDDDDDDGGSGGNGSGPDDDDDDNGMMDDTGSPPGDGAILVLSDAPAFEFSTTGPNQQTPHLFEIENVGTTPATDIEPEGMDPAFAFHGGFPGAGGTCGSELAAGADCLIEVVYTPVKWGTDVTDLVVTYGNAAEDTKVITTLTGKCGGTTENLLNNTGFDSSLGSWTVTEGSWSVQWSTLRFSNVARAGGNGTHVLAQSLNLDQWADAIATGNVRVLVDGDHWASGFNNDPHGFVVVGRNAADVDTTVHESGMMASPGWASHTGDGTAPADSVELIYALVCETSGSNCGGAFDDVSLRLQWP